MVDAMIPVYYPERKPEDFSQIFISVNVKKPSNKSDLMSISREHPSIGCSRSGLPWIAILVDYGVTTSNVTAMFPEPPHGTADTSTCLRIYAAGTTPDTFKFLGHQGSLMTVLQGLMNFGKPPEQHRPIAARLQKHMEFGSTGKPDNMEWE